MNSMRAWAAAFPSAQPLTIGVPGCRGAGIGLGGVSVTGPIVPSWIWPVFGLRFPSGRPWGGVPVAGDGRGNYYVLAEDGTVGFVDTMKLPADSRPAAGACCFLTELLALDQTPRRLGA
jgi:hypothetical protein